MYGSMVAFGIYGISIGGILCWLFLTSVIFMKELENKKDKNESRNHTIDPSSRN